MKTLILILAFIAGSPVFAAEIKLVPGEAKSIGNDKVICGGIDIEGLTTEQIIHLGLAKRFGRCIVNRWNGLETEFSIVVDGVAYHERGRANLHMTDAAVVLRNYIRAGVCN